MAPSFLNSEPTYFSLIRIWWTVTLVHDPGSSLLQPSADPRGGLITAELHLSTRRFCSDKRDQLSRSTLVCTLQDRGCLREGPAVRRQSPYRPCANRGRHAASALLPLRPIASPDP